MICRYGQERFLYETVSFLDLNFFREKTENRKQKAKNQTKKNAVENPTQRISGTGPMNIRARNPDPIRRS